MILWLLALLLLAGSAEAACSGSSPSLTATTYADIASCHTAAVNGDTITVPAGSLTATGQTTITKHVKIIASGTVTITDNSASGTTETVSIFDVTESTVGNTRISGFTFLTGTAVHASPVGMITVHEATGGKPVIVDSNSFSVTGPQGNILYWRANRGLIYNNDATGIPQGANCFNAASFIRSDVDTSTWRQPSVLGNADTNGDQNLYVDNNRVTFLGEGFDLNAASRWVMRFNTITSSGVIVHSGNLSGRLLQAYKNIFIANTSAQATCDNPAAIPNMGVGISISGGAGLVLDNTVPPVDLSPWWGVKLPLEFNDRIVRRALGDWACWTGGGAPGNIAYPHPTQPGWGYTSGGTSITSQGPAWTQDLEPYVFAGNSGSGNYDNLNIVTYTCTDGAAGGSCDYPDTVTCGTRALLSDYVQPDRDFYQQAASFNGTSGTGSGTLAARPATCTAGVYYWATDQGSWNTTSRMRGATGTTDNGISTQGILYKCTSTNTWATWMTPPSYPHTLVASSTSGGTVAPRARHRWHGPHAKPERMENL